MACAAGQTGQNKALQNQIPRALQVQVKLERAGLFHPEQARAALELLHVRGMPRDLRASDRLNILNTMVLHLYSFCCAPAAVLHAVVMAMLRVSDRLNTLILVCAHSPSASLCRAPAHGRECFRDGAKMPRLGNLPDPVIAQATHPAACKKRAYSCIRTVGILERHSANASRPRR